MASNQNLVLQKYGDGTREDLRAKKNRSASLEFHYTKRHLEGLITKNSRVLEVGCGTGYYGMYYASQCKNYVGVDIVPSHIEIFREKIKQAGMENVSCSVGDATNLKEFTDESFDVVLCLGPIYHLPAEERELVAAECNRVCKKGGIVALAYINKVGAYAGACIYDDWREVYPNERANDLILKQESDDSQTGLFFYTTAEDMETLAKKNNLQKIKNLGTDFMIAMKIVNDMSDEKFELLKPLYDEMTSRESCTGMSNHALMICKKL